MFSAENGRKPQIFAKTSFFRGRHGGVEKEGGGKPHEWHPSQSGFGPPIFRYAFHPPLVSLLFFPCRKAEGTFRGAQKFSGGSVVQYVFLPPYVLHPCHGPVSLISCLPFGALLKHWRQPLEEKSTRARDTRRSGGAWLLEWVLAASRGLQSTRQAGASHKADWKHPKA